MKLSCRLLAFALLPCASADDGDTGTPPPPVVSYTRHVAATSSVHDPRTSYTHLPVMSGRPVNDTPVVICTWSGCDILTWNYPGISLTITMSFIGEGGEAGGPEGTSPVPPPVLPDDCWLLYDACGMPVYDQWLADSAALLALPAPFSLPPADPDGEGISNEIERAIHMHPFDSRSGFSISPHWLLTPGEPAAIAIEFAGLSGHVYALEWSPDMSPGSWQTVQEPFYTPDTMDEVTDIGPNRYFIYALVANLPPETTGLPRYFLRMTAPAGMEETAARAGSGGGAAAAQFSLIPPSDEHAPPTSPLRAAQRLGGRFINPPPGTPAGITFNESYVRNPAGGAVYQPLSLPSDFDLNDPLCVFDAVFRSLPPRVDVFPTENYYYWSLRLGTREIRGNINLSVRSRDTGVLSFYYGELLDVIVNGAPRRYQLVGGRQFGAQAVSVLRENALRYKVTRGRRSVNFDLHNLRQTSLPADVLRPGETVVERTFDESGLRFLLINQSAGPGRPATFSWLLDPGPWEPPFTAPGSGEFAPLPGAPGTFKHLRTGFIFSSDSNVIGTARRLVLISVPEEHVARNTWFDGPGDQLADNFEITPLKPLLLDAFPSLTSGGIDNFGYFTQANGSERIGLYVYGGHQTDAAAAAFANSLRPVAVAQADTGSLWNATITAAPVAVTPPPLRFAFADGGGGALPAGVTLTGAERNATTGQLTVQTAELHETPTLPRVWMTKTQKGTVVSIDAPASGGAGVVGEYRTAPEVVTRAGPQGHPWRDGFSPGPTTVAVDDFGECWVANTGDNRVINGIEMGSVTRIGLILGGTRCLSDGTPDASGGYLKPPFHYISPSVRDRDGDGLIRTAVGLAPLPWPGTADAARLDGQVTEALDELITGYVRTHARSVSALALRADGMLWAGSAETRTYSLINTLTARPLAPPQAMIRSQAAVIDEAGGILWSHARGRVSRHEIANTPPQPAALVETLDTALGPAAAQAGAITAYRDSTAGPRLWIASSDPAITNELSRYTVNTAGFTRLPLTEGNFTSRGIEALTQLTDSGAVVSPTVIATERSTSLLPAPLTEPAAAGSWWVARGTSGLVVRREVPRNPDIPAPFNRGLAGVSQGQGRTLWFADFLGHRAIQSDTAGTILQSLNLYTQAQFAQALASAINQGSNEPFHRLAGPWTHGDMTGMNRPRRGNAAIIRISHDSQRDGHQWKRVLWSGTGLTPDNIRVGVRAGDTPLNFPAPLRDIANGANFPHELHGRYLEIYIQLRDQAALSSIAAQ